LLVQAVNAVPENLDQQADVFLVAVGDVQASAIQLAERIRDQLPFIRLLVNCGGGNFKSQFKKADKSGADIALILGEDEARAGKVTLKYLREEAEQQTLFFDEAIRCLQSFE
jgi:histidyl-tRNA synthetase